MTSKISSEIQMYLCTLRHSFKHVVKRSRSVFQKLFVMNRWYTGRDRIHDPYVTGMRSGTRTLPTVRLPSDTQVQDQGVSWWRDPKEERGKEVYRNWRRDPCSPGPCPEPTSSGLLRLHPQPTDGPWDVRGRRVQTRFSSFKERTQKFFLILEKDRHPRVHHVLHLGSPTPCVRWANISGHTVAPSGRDPKSFFEGLLLKREGDDEDRPPFLHDLTPEPFRPSLVPSPTRSRYPHPLSESPRVSRSHVRDGRGKLWVGVGGWGGGGGRGGRVGNVVRTRP